MAVENDDRDNLSFKMGELQDLGIKSTKKIIDAGEAFLSGNLDDIETLEDDEEDPDKPVIKVKDTKKATTPQQKENKPQQKTTVIENTNKGLSEEDAYSLLNQEEEATTTEDNEEEEALIVVKDNKKAVAKTPAATTPTKEEGQTEEAQAEEDDPNAIFNTVAAEMVNQGIFQVEEDEEGNPIVPEINSGEELLALFQENARREAGAAIENFLNGRGEEARAIFNSIIVDGVSPREYISRYAQVQDYKNLDLTIEDNQEKVVREFYRQAGYSPEAIDKNVKRLKDNSDLASEAEEAKKVVVKKEEEAIKNLADQKKRDDENEQRVRSERLHNLANILNEKAKTKDFDGIPVSPQEAKETYDYLTVEKYKLGDQLLTEFDRDILELNRPNNHPLKVKVGLLMRMLKTDPKFTSLSKKVVSKESNEAFQGLRKRNSKAGATGTTKDKQQTATVKDDDKITSWFPNK